MLVEANASSPAVTGAIRQAARMTGTSFQYLLATAQVESNFNPKAGAATSSARGLFQFIEQTWLATLKEQGPALGYGRYANAIGRNASGDYTVTNPRLHNAVMNLRTDPTANALMAGAFTRDNSEKLTGALGRKPTEGELYIAHFLGPQGAARLIGLAEESPRTNAAAAFPNAARANPSIFHGGRGPRSVSEVYRMLVGRYAAARAPLNPQAPAVAQNTAPPSEASAAKRLVPVQPGQFTQRTMFAPDTAALTETYAAASKLTAPPEIAEVGPVFHGLFRNSAGREAVAPVVSALWTAPPATPPAAPAEPTAVAAAAVAQPGVPLDLFQEQAPDIRALFRGRASPG